MNEEQRDPHGAADRPDAHRPSLAQAVGQALRRCVRGRRTPGRPGSDRPGSDRHEVGDAWWTSLAIVVLAASASALLAGAAGYLRAAAIARGNLSTAEPARVGAAGAAIAQVYVAPDMDAELVKLAAHLPAGLEPASIARDESGRMRFSLLTADPDAVRDRLRREQWFGRFAETRQGIAADGRIEMVLEERR